MIGLLPAMWCILFALVDQMCAAGWLTMLACACLTCLLCFTSPNTAQASGSLLFLQRVSYRLAALHALLVMCPPLPRHVMLAGYAGTCPSDLLSLFSFAHTTHASGSLLFMQRVSGPLAALHVVLVMRSRCPDVR